MAVPPGCLDLQSAWQFLSRGGAAGILPDHLRREIEAIYRRESEFGLKVAKPPGPLYTRGCTSRYSAVLQRWLFEKLPYGNSCLHKKHIHI